MGGDDGGGASTEDRSSSWFGGALAGIAVIIFIAPRLLVQRFVFAHEHAAPVAETLRAAAPACLAMAFSAWLCRTRFAVVRPRAHLGAQGMLAVIGFVSLTTCLSGWIIDDAAITFAYSKNLASGHGLVIRPGHVPEEGYSNTLWMLFLAAVARLGGDIASAAKQGGVAAGALAVALAQTVWHRMEPHRGRPRFAPHALSLTVCVGAPFVIWSASGLEHGLQALALMTVVAAPLWPAAERKIMGAALCALVLLRPEAPLMIALVSGVLALDAVAALGPPGPRVPVARALAERWRGWSRAIVRRTWPVLLPPALTWLALLVFRLAYFHDPLPNPYYAKASTANWWRLVNFVGGGWSYLFGWLADARTLLVVPLLLLAPVRRTPLSLRLAIAVCLGQLGFLLFAGGDWMGCYRFVAPVLPVLATLVFGAVQNAGRHWRRLASERGLLVLVWCLGLGTLGQLMAFRAAPTTPTAIVGQIAGTFAEVGRRLGVAHPSLAHHDAGATSYETDLDFIDLGGLADRIVAKHMSDRAFMRRYLFEERRPTFIFGSSHTFAAGATDFPHMPEFSADYVPLRFVNRPYMNAELCHVRRDVIHAVPGIHPSANGPGEAWLAE